MGLERSVLGAFRSFNPLPPPKRGEIKDRLEKTGLNRVSIRSPRRSEGRSQQDAFNPLPPPDSAGVSIRSPRRSEGRYFPDAIANNATCRSFNPLPPPKRGGDRIIVTIETVTLNVSIRSPRRSEGR